MIHHNILQLTILIQNNVWHTGGTPNRLYSHHIIWARSQLILLTHIEKRLGLSDEQLLLPYALEAKKVHTTDLNE